MARKKTLGARIYAAKTWFDQKRRKLNDKAQEQILGWLGLSPRFYLPRRVIELNNFNELKKLYGWTLDPILDDEWLYKFEIKEDINERRLRDAEALGTIARNIQPAVCLDIGTSLGRSAALLAVNAPQAQIFTINIPPEEAEAGEGGTLITVALERERIGSYYRERGLKNITQILSNTATWNPNIGTIDLAFVDGCHDTEFVINDTKKILPYMRSGGFILWHDFNLEFQDKIDWINSVCKGVDILYRRRLLKGFTYHIRDSWVGIYRVP